MAVQLAKVGRALTLGRTGASPPAQDGASADPATGDEQVRANAVRPLAFKSLVGKGHPEFASAR